MPSGWKLPAQDFRDCRLTAATCDQIFFLLLFRARRIAATGPRASRQCGAGGCGVLGERGGTVSPGRTWSRAGPLSNPRALPAAPGATSRGRGFENKELRGLASPHPLAHLRAQGSNAPGVNAKPRRGPRVMAAGERKERGETRDTGPRIHLHSPPPWAGASHRRPMGLLLSCFFISKDEDIYVREQWGGLSE